MLIVRNIHINHLSAPARRISWRPWYMSDYITSLYINTFLKILKQHVRNVHYNALQCFCLWQVKPFAYNLSTTAVCCLGNRSVVKYIIEMFHTQPPKILNHKNFDTNLWLESSTLQNRNYFVFDSHSPLYLSTEWVIFSGPMRQYSCLFPSLAAIYLTWLYPATWLTMLSAHTGDLRQRFSTFSNRRPTSERFLRTTFPNNWQQKCQLMADISKLWQKLARSGRH